MPTILSGDVLRDGANGKPTGVLSSAGDDVEILGKETPTGSNESFTKVKLLDVPDQPEGWVHSDTVDPAGVVDKKIDRDQFARECVRQASRFGVGAHYLMGAAQLRSKIANDKQGLEIGPFRLKQVDWDANMSDAGFELKLASSDIFFWRLQCTMFAFMTRQKLDGFMAAHNGITPSALELYQAQSPAANPATLFNELKSALDETSAEITKAEGEVLDDPASAGVAVGGPTDILMRRGAGGTTPVRGHLVEKVQEALIRSNDLAAADVAADNKHGVLEAATVTALRAWQKKNGFAEADAVTHEQWSKLTGEPLPDIFERCAQVTAAFENSAFGFGHVNKDNSDHAVLTFGYHGYTVSGGNLQKFLKEIDNKHPDLLDTTFGAAKAAELRSIFPPISDDDAITKGKAIFLNGNDVKPDWIAAFKIFGETNESKAEQLAFTRREYWTPAEAALATMKLGEPLSHALCFDVSVQNGPGRAKGVATATVSQFTQAMGEKDKRLLFAQNVVAAISVFSADTKSRKVDTLVDGSGEVHHDLYHLFDWGFASNEGLESDSHSPGGPVSTNAEFNAFFAATFPGLTEFSPSDFLVKGGLNATNHLNTDPPKELWPNVKELVRVLVALKQRLGNPSITFNSVYRSPRYNASVGGASSSQHMRFTAADIVIHNGGNPSDWANVLRGMRQGGLFKGGIGLYSSFVHVDTRGFNADWKG
jgi:hypothetical protein